MSYNALETSVESGRPVEGFMFAIGPTVWRYVSGTKDFLDSAGHVWKACAISSDSIKQTGEAVSDTLSITAPYWIGPVQLHTTTPPSNPIQVTIHRQHLGDVANQMIVAYSGEIRQVNFPEPGKATILCETTSASMQREGLRLAWQRGCPHALYDELTCRVNKADFLTTFHLLDVGGGGVVTDVGGSYESGLFTGGFLEWTDPVRGVERRGIELHSGPNLTIFGQTDDMYPGMVVSAFPGCNRTLLMCASRFNNVPNYGGVIIDGKSPFDGTPVF